MSRPVVSSDLHLGHVNALKWRIGGFKTIEEHDDTIINAHVKTIKKNDLWICLGDVAWTKEALLRLKDIKCDKKILILGNHCTEGRLSIEDYLEVFDEVHAYQVRTFQKTKYILSHMPIGPAEHRDAVINIHGHKHMGLAKDPRKINVCVEHTDWGAVTIESLINAHKEKRKSVLFRIWSYLWSKL